MDTYARIGNILKNNIGYVIIIGIPPKCTSQMMFDLFYRLLPMNMDSHPFYLNTFLPVFTSTGYGTQNIYLPLKSYVDLEEAIIKHMQKHGLTMKGETA